MASLIQNGKKFTPVFFHKCVDFLKLFFTFIGRKYGHNFVLSINLAF